MSIANERWDICRFTSIATFITGYMLCSVSLLTLTAISVDRLLTLLLGLRYRQVVTLKRAYVAVIISWVVSIVGSALYFWSYHITQWLSYIAVPLCLVTSIYSHTKIFISLRHHQTQVQDNVQGQQSQAIPLNTARYRKQCPLHCGCS